MRKWRVGAGWVQGKLRSTGSVEIVKAFFFPWQRDVRGGRGVKLTGKVQGKLFSTG